MLKKQLQLVLFKYFYKKMKQLSITSKGIKSSNLDINKTSQYHINKFSTNTLLLYKINSSFKLGL